MTGWAARASRKNHTGEPRECAQPRLNFARWRAFAQHQSRYNQEVRRGEERFAEFGSHPSRRREGTNQRRPLEKPTPASQVYPTRAKFWEWPTILSLDAPLVAVLWQGLFAQVFGVALGWHHAALLAACVWLLYSADRLCDGLFGRLSRTRRHLFYTAYRRPIIALWLFVFAASVSAALLTLRPGELVGGLLVLAAVLFYFVRVHLLPYASFELPKEVQVAFLFAAGVALFVVPQLAALSALHLTLPLGLFSVLCLLNCALIGHWEKELDAQPLEHSLLRYGALRSKLPQAALGLTCCAALLLFDREVAPLYGAISLSALLLFELSRAQLSPAALRVLGDAALLTPAPLLLTMWLLA